MGKYMVRLIHPDGRVEDKITTDDKSYAEGFIAASKLANPGVRHQLGTAQPKEYGFVCARSCGNAGLEKWAGK